MRSEPQPREPVSAKRSILCIGAGGIAAPFALALAGAPRAALALRLVVIDDDVVEPSNLHRQILFGEDDLGQPKTLAMKRALAARAPGLEVETIDGRFLPDDALRLAAACDLLVDASDNFATRFLAADAAHLAQRPVVHAASVRWNATVLAAPARGGPCYRCLFEDLPSGDAPDCATAGVFGPVCGVSGAIAAALAIDLLLGGPAPFGRVHTYDGRRDRLRAVNVAARASCPLCGASPSLLDIDAERYVFGCEPAGAGVRA
jgi:adenylyltransferase/sulfurtransferase